MTFMLFTTLRNISVKHKHAILFLSYAHCQNVLHDVVDKERG